MEGFDDEGGGGGGLEGWETFDPDEGEACLNFFAEEGGKPGGVNQSVGHCV